MATTGETVWASLIASQKVTPDQTAEVKECYLVFSFGKWIHFSTKKVKLSDFRLTDHEFVLPSRIRAVVYLHFLQRVRGGRMTQSLKFRLVWPYFWKAGSHLTSQSTCVFPARALIQLRDIAAPDRFSPYAKYSKFFLAGYRGVAPPGGVVLRPTKLFNLSLTTPILVPRKTKLAVRVVKVRTPYPRKLLLARANPEIKTKLLTNAVEAFGQPYSEVGQAYEVYRRAWTGTVTPGFGGLKKAQLPVNPHTVDLAKTTWTPGYDLRRTYANPLTTYTNAWGAYLYPFTRSPVTQLDPFWVDVENAAISKLNAAANAGIQANVALTMAEYRQFGSMVASTASRLTKSILALKKGQFTKAADALFDGSFKMQGTTSRGFAIKPGNPTKSKSLARNWLELQYGWKPLLNDAREAARSLIAYAEDAKQSQSVIGSATRSRVFKTGIKGPVPTAASIGQEIGTVMLRCKFGITFKTDLNNFSLLSRLGFTNPINLVWELLPYSFVVDWFLPLGPYFESMSAPHSVLFEKGYKTRFGKQYLALDVSHNGPMPGALASELRSFAARTQLSVTLNRSILLGWPTARFPRLKNPLSEIHILNALALMRVAFK